MADLGGLDCAASQWLHRLGRESRLPAQGTLEALRRREVSARERAEVVADAERRSAAFAQELLEQERRAGASRAEALAEAHEALAEERRKRAQLETELQDARAALRQAEADMATQAAGRRGAEEELAKAGHRVAELRECIQGDTTLSVLDEFREKFDAQRSEISHLRDRLEIVQAGATSSDMLRKQEMRVFEASRRQWEKDKVLLERAYATERTEKAQVLQDKLVLECERNKERADRERLLQAGVVLQHAAEVALQASCTMAAAMGRRECELVADAVGSAEALAALAASMHASQLELQRAAIEIAARLGLQAAG